MTENEIYNAILNDDTDIAEKELSKEVNSGLEIVSSLLKKTKNKPYPLKKLQSRLPKLINISTSYTCNLGCKMCLSGFQDTLSHSEEKHLTPENFKKLLPWVEKASHITFAGIGETMYSPYVLDFIRSVNHKVTILLTSGVNLNPSNIKEIIESKLSYLQLSFDGKSSVGHGGGEEKYINDFWKKVNIIQEIKKKLKSKSPHLCLRLTLDKENFDGIDEIVEEAQKNGIDEIIIALMYPLHKDYFGSSFFSSFQISKKLINKKVKQWKNRGMEINVSVGYKKLHDSNNTCFYVDNFVNFALDIERPTVCCTSFNLPMEISGGTIYRYWNSFQFRYLRYLHFCSESNDLPALCKICWTENPQKFSEVGEDFLTPKNLEKEYSLYNRASNLKCEGKLSEAQGLFLNILDLNPDFPLIGKTYFHLGEIVLAKKEYKEALSYFTLAVQHHFEHKKAFVYLYLLLRLLEKPKQYKRKKKFNLTWLKENCL
ncbi:MAG: hypothetical protein HQK84_03895 [Nitrospinae bacterium]|nr:hypothetical protein [Nitrospinota bacterium]